MTELKSRLDAASAAATQGEWAYRPNEHDDWGVIKSEPRGEYGFRCVLAQFRDPDALDEDVLRKHRKTKTDPWAGNAQFVCELVNAYRAGRLAVVPEARRGTECNQSHDGRHHIDTSMEEGPHHCFHCGTDMRITQSETHDVD